MDRTPRRRRLSLGLLALTIVGAAFVGTTPAVAVKATCAVTNATTGVSYGADLQGAIDAAAAGDRLVVSGRCLGSFTVTSSLTIAERAGTKAVLDAAGAGRTLTVAATGDLVLSGVTVTGGRADNGGGVFNSGALVLRDTEVRGNVATGLGGGIANCLGCSLTLEGVTSVRNNSALRGGGIYSVGSLSLVASASVSGNTAADGGGGVYSISGSVSMAGSSSVARNTAGNDGGGLYTTGGPFAMTDAATVTGNRADADGDGVGTGGGVFSCLAQLSGVVDGGNVDRNFVGKAGNLENNLALC